MTASASLLAHCERDGGGGDRIIQMQIAWPSSKT